MRKFKKITSDYWFLIKPWFIYGRMYLLISTLSGSILPAVAQYFSVKAAPVVIDGIINANGDPAWLHKLLWKFLLYTLIPFAANMLENMISQYYLQMKQMTIQKRIVMSVYDQALKSDIKHYDDPEFYNSYTYSQSNYPNSSSIVIQEMLSSVTYVFRISSMLLVVSEARNFGWVMIGITIAFGIGGMLLRMMQNKFNVDMSEEINVGMRKLQYVQRTFYLGENAADLKTTHAGKLMRDMYNNFYSSYIESYQRMLSKQIKFGFGSSFLSQASSIAVTVFALVFVVAGKSENLGTYTAVTQAAALIGSYFTFLLSNIASFHEYVLYADKIRRFYDAPNIIEPSAGIGAEVPDGAVDVEFRGVGFSYPGSSFGIKDLNLHFTAGHKTAIVGENGAGKSTLTKLLLRLYDVDEGAILINGRDLREYDILSIRKKLGISFQDTRLFAMTLRENASLYNETTEDKLREVFTELGLDGVLAKAGGDFNRYMTREFAEDGIVLSGGETQKLGISRLFTGDFGMLILDEPSSALDPLAESRLMETLHRRAAGTTMLMIAHRLSTIIDADVIYHIESGAVIETGTHSELMSAQGKYYEMFTRQAESYLTAGDRAEEEPQEDALDPRLVALMKKLPQNMIDSLTQMADSGML